MNRHISFFDIYLDLLDIDLASVEENIKLEWEKSEVPAPDNRKLLKRIPDSFLMLPSWAIKDHDVNPKQATQALNLVLDLVQDTRDGDIQAEYNHSIRQWEIDSRIYAKWKEKQDSKNKQPEEEGQTYSSLIKKLENGFDSSSNTNNKITDADHEEYFNIYNELGNIGAEIEESNDENKKKSTVRDLNRLNIKVNKVNGTAKSLQLGVILNALTYGFEHPKCFYGTPDDLFIKFQPYINEKKLKSYFFIAEILEIIWEHKLFSEGNKHINGLLDECNLHDKRLKDIGIWFSIKQDLIKANTDDSTAAVEQQKHVAGLKKEISEIESRLNLADKTFPVAINNSSKGDKKPPKQSFAHKLPEANDPRDLVVAANEDAEKISVNNKRYTFEQIFGDSIDSKNIFLAFVLNNGRLTRNEINSLLPGRTEDARKVAISKLNKRLKKVFNLLSDSKHNPFQSKDGERFTIFKELRTSKTKTENVLNNSSSDDHSFDKASYEQYIDDFDDDDDPAGKFIKNNSI